MTDNDQRFADLAMKAANQRTHLMIEKDVLTKRVEELEAAARRVTVSWIYYQSLVDYVEFEDAMRDLSRMVEVKDDPRVS